MFAIIATGGKQYKVAEGMSLRVEKLEKEVKDSFCFDQVLMVGKGSEVKIGTPHVQGAKVEATVVHHGRGKKVVIFKKKKRTTYQRCNGHRQDFTEVRITKIQA